MHIGQTIFAQLMHFIPAHEFHRCVDRYRGDYKVSTFPCWDQFLCMAFAQLTGRESLRDIETGLRAMGSKLYHAGWRGHIARSNLADANETRDYRIYADLAQVMIATARPLYAQEDFGVELAQTVYALDATTLDLCRALFPWARYRAQNAAVKMHTLLDLRGSLPAYIDVKPAKIHEIHTLDELLPEPGSFYVMDRAYLDFQRLYNLHRERAFFVTRAKSNLKFKRRCSYDVDKITGVQCDQIIMLTTHYPAQKYPEPLRRIRFNDPQRQKRLVFLTNNFELPAETIAQLYKARWHIEQFFKWIKQHLRIKSFFGISENAVKVQIWTAISAYLLIAIMKKELRLQQSLYTILQVLSMSLFEKMPILQAFSQQYAPVHVQQIYKQLSLFD